MVQFNTLSNEILFKIVYYGPALSGKTANLQILHSMCREGLQGEFFSVNTQEDRTLFFDLLPIDLGSVYGNSIRLKIYTVPGQPQYDATRRVVLDSADAVVFVADSEESKLQENIDSLTNLQQNLTMNGLDIKQIPLAIQYNKRDLPSALPVGVLNRKLNFRSAPYFEAVALTGQGVLETFTCVAKEAVSTVFKRHQLGAAAQNLNAVLEAIEKALRQGMDVKSAGMAGTNREKTTIVRQENTSVEDLPEGRLMDPTDLLADALNSGMEAAKLYSDQKKETEGLKDQNAELARLKEQLEKANQDNQNVRKFLENLLQSIGEAIISFGIDGRIYTWNKAAESLFGYTYSETVGNNIDQFAPADLQAKLAQAIIELSKGSSEQIVLGAITQPSGAKTHVAMSLYPVIGTGGTVVAASSLVKKV